MKVGGKPPTLKHPPTIKRTIVKASFILFCHSLENSPLFKSLITIIGNYFLKNRIQDYFYTSFSQLKLEGKKGRHFHNFNGLQISNPNCFYMARKEFSKCVNGKQATISKLSRIFKVVILCLNGSNLYFHMSRIYTHTQNVKMPKN